MRVAKPLTDTRIRGIKPSSARQRICDGAGLYLVTAPKAGSHTHQTWEYRFLSPLTGRISTVKLGDYPATTLAAARVARGEAERGVARGLDPAIERKRARVLSDAPTLESVAKAWDASRAGDVDDLTRKTAMGRLTRFVFPTLGSRLLSQVLPADLRRALDLVVASGAKETAHRTCTVLMQIFEWAEARGEVMTNPLRLLRRAYPAAPATHHAAIVDQAGFGSLLLAIDGYQGRAVTKLALRLLPLVFLRSSEFRGAVWPEIDLSSATWTVPAARMKIRENGAHVVPLARQTVELFSELRAITGPREGQDPARARVFPGARPGKVLSENTINAALTTLGFGHDVHRGHGFRSSASTLLNELAVEQGGRVFNFEHVEAQLAHRSADAVRDAYQRSQFLGARRAMMHAWADLCDTMKTGATRARIMASSSETNQDEDFDVASGLAGLAYGT